MALLERKGNILNLNHGIICHQVNCQGVMGAGLAFGIRRRFPGAYSAYMVAYAKGLLSLGAVVYYTTQFGLVANLCAQDRYGRDRQHTDYDAMRICLRSVNGRSEETQLPVYIPKGMGCGLAGGNWSIVEGIIETELPWAIIMNYEK